jgi:outer membrane protein OmpA-like peptidoglycan-associated protein
MMRHPSYLETRGFESYPELGGGNGWQGETNRRSQTYVRWVQRSLNQILGLHLAVDGIPGAQIRSAIRSFQERYGLTADGIAGPRTEAAIKVALGAGPSSPARKSDLRCAVLDRFRFDQVGLRSFHQPQIASIARRLVASQRSSSPVRSVHIVGHTDPVGSATYNRNLGRRRAEAVTHQLRKAMERIKPGSAARIRFGVDSRGESEPASSDPARNRRVQVCWKKPAAACVIRPLTLIETELAGAAPRSRRILRAPHTRPCCMLAPQNMPGTGPNANFAVPGRLGKHGSSNEVNGLIYTGKAGFLDLGHIRDMVDLTKFIFDQLTGAGVTPNQVVAEFSLGGRVIRMGEATMRQCPAHPIQVARAIAYDTGLGHEIVSYNIMTPGGHNSSFSPEDLCSNFLGTLLAERAILAKGSFNDAVTRELDRMVRDLNGQSRSQSRRAFDRINGRWVDWSNFLGAASFTPGYLKRRNFDRIPFKTGHSSDAATPNYVVAPMRYMRSVYRYTHTEGGRSIPASGYGNEINRIKRDARRRYGPNFDKP